MGELKIDPKDGSTAAHQLNVVSSGITPPKQSNLTKKIIIFLISVGIVFALFGHVKKAIGDFLVFETTDDASIAGNSSVISAKVGGIVTKVLFEDHATVKKGDLLIQLDRREFENTVNQLQADLAAATAIYEASKRELERGQFDNIVQQRRNELESEGALLEEAKLDLDRGEFDTVVKRRKSELEAGTALLEEARRSFRRIEELKKKDLISDVEYDTSKTNFENHVAKVGTLRVLLKEAELSAQRAQEAAQAKFRSLESKQKKFQVQLRDALNSSETLHDKAVAAHRAALARVWSTRAQLDQAKLNLEFTEIRAPADGVVSRRAIQPGMIIKPNQPLTTLLSSDEKWVISNFKETQLTNIYVGQPVEIEIDAIEGRTFEGTVQSISPGSGSVFALIPPDNATGNFTKIVQRVPVKIVFKPKAIAGYERFLIPGISVYVKARLKGR